MARKQVSACPAVSDPLSTLLVLHSGFLGISHLGLVQYNNTANSLEFLQAIDFTSIQRPALKTCSFIFKLFY